MMKQKILYFSASSVPSRTANSVHVMKMCQAISEIGYRVSLFALSGQIKANPFDFYGTKKTFEITLFEPNQTPLLGSFFYALRTTFLYRKRVNEFDLIYSRSLWVSVFCLLFTSTQLIHESHSPPKNLIHRFFEGWLLEHRRCVLFVVISEALRKMYSSRFPRHRLSKVLVEHDAADLFENLSMGLPKEHFHLAYIGSLQKGRGLEMIVELARARPLSKFTVVGGSHSEVNSWREKAKDCPNLSFEGHIPHSQIKNIIETCDALLAPYQRETPSIDWASPMKIFEYMASGRAIICSDFPVFREVLRHGENALLCKADELQAWIDAHDLLQSAETRHRIAQSAMNDVKANHLWKQRATRILNAALRT